MPNNWIIATKQWNAQRNSERPASEQMYCVPKKNTPEYAEVMEIMLTLPERTKAPRKKKDLSKKIKETIEDMEAKNKEFDISDAEMSKELEDMLKAVKAKTNKKKLDSPTKSKFDRLKMMDEIREMEQQSINEDLLHNLDLNTAKRYELPTLSQSNIILPIRHSMAPIDMQVSRPVMIHSPDNYFVQDDPTISDIMDRRRRLMEKANEDVEDEDEFTL